MGPRPGYCSRMEQRSLRVIYNPTAAQGAAEALIPGVEHMLEETGVEFDLVRTEYHGHAIELARRAAEDAPYAVIAGGGDGTAGEVLNGLMQAKSVGLEIPAMGILPVGRGNDFAYGAGFPRNLREAVETVARGTPRPFDAGYVKGGDFPDGRYFGNGIGIGFDTIVGFEAAKMVRLKGFSAYIAGAIRTISRFYDAPLVQLRYNGAEFASRSIQISIMNGRRMGGAFFMAPKADTADGMFDLCIAGEPKRRQMLSLIVRYMKGTQAASRFIRMERARSLEIDALDGTLAVHADGETVCEAGTRLEVTCLRHAVRMLGSPVDHP